MRRRLAVLLTCGGLLLASLSTLSANASTTTFAYDDLGRLTGVTKGGVTTTYTYDAAGNRTAVAVGSGGGGGGNHNPVAQNQYVSGGYDCGFHCYSLGVVDLLVGATDADSDTLTVSAVGSPSSGSVTNTTGSYYLYSGSNPTDSFTYTISDGHGGTSTATVYIVDY